MCNGMCNAACFCPRGMALTQDRTGGYGRLRHRSGPFFLFFWLGCPGSMPRQTPCDLFYPCKWRRGGVAFLFFSFGVPVPLAGCWFGACNPVVCPIHVYLIGLIVCRQCNCRGKNCLPAHTDSLTPPSRPVPADFGFESCLQAVHSVHRLRAAAPAPGPVRQRRHVLPVPHPPHHALFPPTTLVHPAPAALHGSFHYMAYPRAHAATSTLLASTSLLAMASAL